MNSHKPCDPSVDYFRYPTFAPIPQPFFRCTGCGGTDFGFLLPKLQPRCKRCGLEPELSLTAEKPVQKSLPHIQICGSDGHIVVLRPDGTVRAIGDNKYGQCNVERWTGITAIAAGSFHTVGLCADGTVRVTGENVEDWTGITAIATSGLHTVGLCADGTVRAVGYNGRGQCNVQDWTDVAAIWAGPNFTAAMRKNGELLCTDPEIQTWLRKALT